MKKRNQSHKRFLSAKPSSATDRTSHYRLCQFSILVLGVFLSGCSGLFGEEVEPMTPRYAGSQSQLRRIGAGSAAAEFTFDQYEVVTGAAKRQTVLTGFLLGGAIAELAVVNIDLNNDRRSEGVRSPSDLHIYAFGDGTWAPRLKATLRPEVLFVDVANIDGRDRLVTYEPGRLNWFDPESGTEHKLVAAPSNYKAPRSDEIPHVHVTRDLNDDGHDDLVVPDSDGFWVFIQMSDGAFAEPVKLGPATGIGQTYESDGYRYNPWSQSRIHEMDYNRDGRNDLVFWNEDHFEVHLQDEHGLFAAAAETFTTEVAFDSDDLASLAAPQGVRGRRKDHQPMGNLTGRVLHTLTDMNGDGVADLVVFSLLGGSLWKMHSTYEVHFGTPTADGTVFAPDVGATIQSDGIPFGLEQHDFDHDGERDMMFTIIEPGIFMAIRAIIGAVLTGSVSVDLKFYRMDGGIYPDKPNATRKIKSHPGDSGERTAFSSVLLGDVNGDGRSDLLVQNGREELRVYLGVPGAKLFAKRPQKVKVAMPNEEYTWLVDLNKDGVQEILRHHPSTTEPHRVTMLLAR